MKKLFKTSLVILASLGLVGCGEASSSVEPTSESTTTTAETTSKTTTSDTSSVTHTLDASFTGTAKVGKTITFTGTYDGAALTKTELANATFTASVADAITFNGNVGTCVKAGAVIVTMTYSGVTATIDITIADVTKIGTINSAAAYEIEGVITAMNTKSSIVSDETGSIMVFGYTSGAIGDYVAVSGTTSKYNSAYQFSTASSMGTGAATVTKIADETGKPTPVAATALTKEIADSFATYSSNNMITPANVKPYTWQTKVGTADSYKTINFEGSDTVIEPIYLSTDITLDVDTYYDITAYFTGYSINSKYAAMVVTSATKSVIAPTAVSVIAADNATSLYVGGTLQLNAAFTPSYATQTALTWTSSDTSKATVDANGLVTGVAAGSVTITATSTTITSVTSSITLEVKEVTANLIGVTLNKTTLDLFAEETDTLTATVTANQETGYATTVSWTSSNEDVATVAADGTITAVAAGTATITATTDGKDANGNSLTAACALTVINKYGDATHPRDIAAIKNFMDTANATSSSAAIGPVFIKGVVESSSYSSQYKNYSIWLQSDDGTVAKSFDIERATLDTSITEGYTDTDALRGKTIVATGYAYKYSSNYQLYTAANSVSPKLLSVADTTEAEVATFSLNYSKYSLDIGKTVQLTSRTYPAQAPVGTTTWATSDASIATVSETGVVTAVAAGTATITATNGAKTATCEITVDPAGLAKVETSIKANEFTADATDSKIATKTDGVVTYTLNQNTSSTTNRLSDSDHLRVYKGAKFSVSISSGTLYTLEFTCITSNYNNFNQTTITNGTITNNENTIVAIKANDNVNSIDIVMNGSASRISKVVVKYIAASESAE